ncbi:unnamed protein product [Psylliodes chrysocephalus]|uniref:Uncharacterized protein n=1 Tax=Psylliodes chrysocephalus TaxID=3402493 RepID=A0A9P0GKU9_9CUCU|nr:unnamed protein product [Psylliodes chrysocephala]
MQKQAAQFGITILGYSSDGDSRLLRSMRINTSLPLDEIEKRRQTVFPKNWTWFCMDIKRENPCFFQDTVHIATKLKTRLFNPKVSMHIGNFVATIDHILYLVKNFSKDQHLLTMSDLRHEDKMNFLAADKICAPSVQSLLTKHVIGSEGTVLYLKIMRYSILGLLDKKISLNDRLYYLWFCVFFLRIWRKWIRKHKLYTIKTNFLSSNCYLCIELNAHSLIHLILQFQNFELPSDIFLPWLMSSQCCEKLFRSTRSMTSTFSTIVNFSIKDLLHRVDRIQIINNTTKDLSGILEFPREDRKNKISNEQGRVNVEEDILMFSKENIKDAVDRALKDVLLEIQKLGITLETENEKNLECWWNEIEIPLGKPKTNLEMPSTNEMADVFVDNDGIDDNSDEENIDNNPIIFEEDNSSEVESILKKSVDTMKSEFKKNIYEDAKQTDKYLKEDLSKLSLNCVFGEKLELKDYSKNIESETDEKTLSANSPFVTVTFSNGKSSVIRKSTLCWLLEEDKERISSDRLQRFISKKRSKKRNSPRKSQISPENIYTRNDATSSGSNLNNIIRNLVRNPKRNSRRRPKQLSETETETDSDQITLDDSTDLEIWTETDSDQMKESSASE